ncbi:MAG TPA: hypothetical protein VFE06_04615, partial [Acidobacteriaceae bacterium]|nr:hypothetical protein [Acidobacteriaceae bacterium]
MIGSPFHHRRALSVSSASPLTRPSRYPLSAVRWLLLCTLSAVPCILLQGCNHTSRPAQVGERAPKIVINDGAQTVALRQYEKQGKVVVL